MDDQHELEENQQGVEKDQQGVVEDQGGGSEWKRINKELVKTTSSGEDLQKV